MRLHLFKTVKELNGISLKQCIFCKKRKLDLNNNKPPEIGEYAQKWVNNEV